jgi:hypothetical protein
MKEDEQLRFVDPDRCTAREQELLGVKKEQFVKPDAGGVLRVQQAETVVKADLTSEHRVRLALQRRSLALDQCDLLEYSISESYHDFLYGLLAMVPPSGFRALDVVQILNIDRAIWARMSEYTTAGISVRPDGTYPIAVALEKARVHPMVVCMMQPPPVSFGGSRQQGKGGQRSAPYEPQDRSGKGSKSSKGSKGKGKGKRNRSGVRMPTPLIGCKSATKDGGRICFDYNLPSGCSRNVADNKCSAGAHVCCGCLRGDHGYQNCK